MEYQTIGMYVGKSATVLLNQKDTLYAVEVRWKCGSIFEYFTSESKALIYYEEQIKKHQ